MISYFIVVLYFSYFPLSIFSFIILPLAYVRLGRVGWLGSS